MGYFEIDFEGKLVKDGFVGANEGEEDGLLDGFTDGENDVQLFTFTFTSRTLTATKQDA